VPADLLKSACQARGIKTTSRSTKGEMLAQLQAMVVAPPAAAAPAAAGIVSSSFC
jgi:hypothetical protein